MIITMLLVTLFSRVAFIAGACYLADSHPVMAAWCIFGAIVCSYGHDDNKKEVAE